MPSVTSLLNDTADIACPAALLLRVHHRACIWLGLISDPVPRHHCDSFPSCSWTAMTSVGVSLCFCT